MHHCCRRRQSVNDEMKRSEWRCLLTNGWMCEHEASKYWIKKNEERQTHTHSHTQTLYALVELCAQRENNNKMILHLLIVWWCCPVARTWCVCEFECERVRGEQKPNHHPRKSRRTTTINRHTWLVRTFIIRFSICASDGMRRMATIGHIFQAARKRRDKN